ncbi:MAG: hypothetical protein RL432_2027 [Bacteroidota bacterium]|jgi:hypothetical protein
MKKRAMVLLKNGLIAKIPAQYLGASNHQLILPSTAVDLPLLVEVTHQGITTLIDLSGFMDCAVLQFGQQRQFIGATSCQNRSSGAFMIQSQAHYFLLVPNPLPFPLAEVDSIEIHEIDAFLR